MNEEELLIAELTAMQIIDFKKLGFINGKETIGKVLKLIEKQQKEIDLVKQKYKDYSKKIKEYADNDLKYDEQYFRYQGACDVLLAIIQSEI